MAVQIKSLKTGVLPSANPVVEADLYPVPLNKTAIVKSIRLVNTGNGTATINLFVRRATGGTSYRIAPKDLSLAPGVAFIDDSEVTLEGLGVVDTGDRVRGMASPTGSTVDYVISGVERDV